ncbi:hypothetical protein LY90DRAFT_513972 [Neocallimastix californiae]|uniref:Uncharacterized protein n=1 Tax=Neocallimastix californiae TaxID=1754190 RepID=A0A1Y2ATH6_9FUNG|nr:hypothetical protein LY90DRAFT_513972 [Neocallimastix californiae]|eukprot:ORY25869.1 hypothetical protein LY90DRAFT_513972 [Neocallimastix californiae]
MPLRPVKGILFRILLTLTLLRLLLPLPLPLPNYIENNHLKQQIMSKDLLINKLMDENRILKSKNNPSSFGERNTFSNPAYPNPSTSSAAAVASDEILMMENGKSINNQELIDRIQNINEMVAKKQDNPVYHSVNEILSQEELPEYLKKT